MLSPRSIGPPCSKEMSVVEPYPRTPRTSREVGSCRCTSVLVSLSCCAFSSVCRQRLGKHRDDRREFLRLLTPTVHSTLNPWSEETVYRPNVLPSTLPLTYWNSVTVRGLRPFAGRTLRQDYSPGYDEVCIITLL